MRTRLITATLLLVLATPAAAQTSLLPTLSAVRADYQAPLSPAELGHLLNRVAWIHRAEGWGLLRKDQGRHCPTPHPVFIACDILVHRPSGLHIDVLQDAEGVAAPVWNVVGPIDLSRFVDPIDPGGIVDPPVDPIDPVLVQVNALAITVAQLRDVVAEQTATIDALRHAVAAMPTCEPGVWAWPLYRMRSPWGFGTFVLRPEPTEKR